jgi:hypothetical protein
LRIPAREVLQDLEPVLNLIVDQCIARPLHHRPSGGGPPPLQGGF